jgi:cobalt-precorrin-7 (C5)-methyltransferase
MSENKLKAYILGIGPTGGDYVTLHAAKVITNCGVVIGWPEALQTAGNYIKDKVVFTQNGSNYQQIQTEAADRANELGVNLASLILGDPLLYPTGIKPFFGQFAGFEIVLIPGVSPLHLAAAAARISLETSRCVMFHPTNDGSIDRKDLVQKQGLMLEAIRSGYNLIIMSDLEQSLSQTANFLVQNGLAPETKVVINQRPGEKTEEVTHLCLSEAIEYNSHWKSVMVVMA